jgi:HSP20 family molecular chaperone IbpA
MSRKKRGENEPLEEWTRKVSDIMEEMNHRSFFEFRSSVSWQPRINLYACGDGFRICVELPGLGLDALCVECPDTRRVRVAGKRHRPNAPDVAEQLTIEAMEIDEGDFVREVELPDVVDTDALEIAYDRGYLWIILPKNRKP